MTRGPLLWHPSSVSVEKLIRAYIYSVLPASLDPLEFAYRSNRSIEDAIAFTLHTALSHLENKKKLMWEWCSWTIVQHLTP